MRVGEGGVPGCVTTCVELLVINESQQLAFIWLDYPSDQTI